MGASERLTSPHLFEEDSLTSFSTIVENAKAAIDQSQSNKQLRAVLVSLADSVTRFANSLKASRWGILDWTSPISFLKEFWAPRDTLVLSEWRQVEDSLLAFRDYIDTIPKDDEAPTDTEAAKQAAIICLANAETVRSFQTDSTGQIGTAVENLAKDVANIPTIIGHAIGATGDIIANGIIKPITDGTTHTVWTILSSIVRGLWWLFLLAAIVIAGYIYVTTHGGLVAIAGRFANG
jgi:hypothetical protein